MDSYCALVKAKFILLSFGNGPFYHKAAVSVDLYSLQQFVIIVLILTELMDRT